MIIASKHFYFNLPIFNTKRKNNSTGDVLRLRSNIISTFYLFCAENGDGQSKTIRHYVTCGTTPMVLLSEL